MKIRENYLNGEHFFNEIDLNGDGSISRVELAETKVNIRIGNTKDGVAMIPLGSEGSLKKADYVLNKFDKNLDKNISKEEFFSK